MEGIAGVMDWTQCLSDKRDYGRGRELMTGEAAAAAEGAFEAGARTVVVGDSHGCMTNLLVERMPLAARLVQGRCKPLSMMHGLDKTFDAVAFVGYHSMMGTQGGVLAHTYSGSIMQCRINGLVVGEPGLNSTLAAAFGVPAVFLSGDEAACREIEALIPGVTTMPVKKGFGTKVCSSLHPEAARAAIRSGIGEALTAQRPAKKTKLPKSPFTLKVLLYRPDMADLCQMIPGVKRIGASEVEFRHADFVTVYGAFLTIMRIAGIARED